MVDFLDTSSNSDNAEIASANRYYVTVRASLAAVLEHNPTLLPIMAQDALECAILGMRMAMPRPAIPSSRRRGIVARLFPRAGASARTHPAFDNDAFSLFLKMLFDVTHNLPAVFAPPGANVGKIPDPVNEIAMTLACLRLLPITRAAVDIRFERYLMNLAPASPSVVEPRRDGSSAMDVGTGQAEALSPRDVAESAAKLVENLQVDGTVTAYGPGEVSYELDRCASNIRAMAA